MVQLSDEQVTIVATRIAAQVNNTALQQDLLDHYCCFIEEQMSTGARPFEEAYSEAFTAISPNGMAEIQEELFFLLTFKKQLNMKRITYGAGFFAAFFISTSIMFKVMHWPGANILSVCGFGLLIVTVATLLASAVRHMNTLPLVHRVRFVTGLAAALLISVGSIFKALHFPSASIQLVLGMVLLNFVFMPLFFFELYKRSIAVK